MTRPASCRLRAKQSWPHTNSLGAIPEIVGNSKSGYLVEPNNSTALARALSELHRHDKAAALGAGTRCSGGNSIRSQSNNGGPSTCLDPSIMHPIAVAEITIAVLVGNCCTSIYAALNCRDLYADASHYLLKIASTSMIQHARPCKSNDGRLS
jgi:hypothetical protein